MPRDVELIQRQFGSSEPLPSIELADNALKLGGIEANLYALKSDLSDEAAALIGNIDEVLAELRDHENDDVRHLTQAQIDKIQAAINATQALTIANGAITDATPSIVSEASQTAIRQSEAYLQAALVNVEADLKRYADGAAGTAETNAKNYADGKAGTAETNANTYTDNKFVDMNFPTYVDPVTGETVEEDLGNTLSTAPDNLINPEYFYRFKNLMDNSSFEVYDGNTKRPYGWDNGVSSGDASMFEARSLKLTEGQTAKQTSQHQANAQWLKGAYDTDDAILSFYHKFDAVIVRIYDVINDSYMLLTPLDRDLSPLGTAATSVEFPEETNWNQYRCMVKFTPANNTQKMRVEFTCANGGDEGECYIDAPSLEPYVEGKYPSIYKHGRYSTSAYQVINPPPEDVDRFTPLEHLTLTTSTDDTNGNVTYQEWERSDGTLAITRSCSNADVNGFYQTIVETFYKKDGVTVNYTDTYSLTYSATGAILTQSKTSTEVVRMSRFDSMISKGINTNDADATDQDILLGKTAYVAGQKVTGTLVPSGGGGNIDLAGFEIDVEAANTISVGDTIVAQENSQYVTPTAVSTQIPVPILSMSEDTSVGIGIEGYTSIPTTNVIGDGTTFNIYFKNEAGNFDTENMCSITLSNYPSTLLLAYAPLLNDDGTIALLGNYSYAGSSALTAENVILVIDIDKANKTASYSYKTFEITNHDYGNQSNYVDLSGLKVYKEDTYIRSFFIKGNYIIAKTCAVFVNKSTGTYNSNNTETTVMVEYTNGSFIYREWEGFRSGSTYYKPYGGYACFSDDLIFHAWTSSNYYYLARYNFTSKTITSIKSVNSVAVCHFSKNGIYWCEAYSNSGSYTYKLSTSDFTYTLEGSFSTTSSSKYSYPSNDGNFLYNAGRGIWEKVNGTYTTKYSSLGGVSFSLLLTNTFEMPVAYMTNFFICAIVPGTAAQYLATSTVSRDCSTADRIYGVASENLAVGTRGKARGIFSTMT